MLAAFYRSRDPVLSGGSESSCEVDENNQLVSKNVCPENDAASFQKSDFGAGFGAGIGVVVALAIIVAVMVLVVKKLRRRGYVRIADGGRNQNGGLPLNGGPGRHGNGGPGNGGPGNGGPGNGGPGNGGPGHQEDA